MQSFLQSNVGKNTLLQVDCVTPYLGTERAFIDEVCMHLNSFDIGVEVKYDMTQNINSECSKGKYLVMRINIKKII